MGPERCRFTEAFSEFRFRFLVFPVEVLHLVLHFADGVGVANGFCTSQFCKVSGFALLVIRFEQSSVTFLKRQANLSQRFLIFGGFSRRKDVSLRSRPLSPRRRLRVGLAVNGLALRLLAFLEGHALA